MLPKLIYSSQWIKNAKFDCFQTIIVHNLIKIYIGIVIPTACVDQTLRNSVKDDSIALVEKK